MYSIKNNSILIGMLCRQVWANLLENLSLKKKFTGADENRPNLIFYWKKLSLIPAECV